MVLTVISILGRSLHDAGLTNQPEGGAISVPSVSTDDLLNSSIPTPSKKVQDEIYNVSALKHLVDLILKSAKIEIGLQPLERPNKVVSELFGYLCRSSISADGWSRLVVI